MYNLVEIRSSPIHGKGVFAKEKIPEGTLFVCDILVFPAELDNNNLVRHSFPHGPDKDWEMCIGFPTFMNHSLEPNMGMFKPDTENMTKTFMATKDIEMGEELTLYYSDEFQKYLETFDYIFPNNKQIIEALATKTKTLDDSRCRKSGKVYQSRMEG